jgi:Zn-dependent peptidase ImmA (M78 family)
MNISITSENQTKRNFETSAPNNPARAVLEAKLKDINAVRKAIDQILITSKAVFDQVEDVTITIIDDGAWYSTGTKSIVLVRNSVNFTDSAKLITILAHELGHHVYHSEVKIDDIESKKPEDNEEIIADYIASKYLGAELSTIRDEDTISRVSLL